MFIDQLAMIQEKTRGNLSNEESSVLRNTIANLQMTFVEVSRDGGASTKAPPVAEAATTDKAETPAPSPAADTEAAKPDAAPVPPDEGESRKKFTKSYGA
jgi:hypothetical protein